MVYYCVCAGCKNSRHKLPQGQRRACSAHFKEEDYHSGDAKMVSLGLKSERMAKLIPTAVPSVHANLSACPVRRSRDTVCRKRDIATMLTDASQQETMDSVILGISPCPPPLLYQAGFSLVAAHGLMCVPGQREGEAEQDVRLNHGRRHHGVVTEEPVWGA
ncbi:hypothetical protein AALO_G00042730 [Alosa alosa]|uniref:THAP-type domain-containing protein n=1 Tax=Alosa alosa TaxID=278164 RepID=A0AAV6H8T4_9TELE|nr:hypothetical protein AALO_G00042730 [Alosa alosa]